MNVLRTPRRDRGLIEGMLRVLPAFADLAPAQLQGVVGHCWVLAAPRGERILRAGEHPPGILAVAYGCVKLALRNGGDHERVFALLAARHTFGEAPALLGRAAPYEAVAMNETKLVVIPGAAVLALIESEPRFAKAWLRSLAEKEYALCAEIGAASLQTGAERLAGYLGELAGAGGGNAECRVELPITKTLLAARLGMKKETLSRLLKQFAARGVIVLGRARSLVVHRQRLATATGAVDAALDAGQVREEAPG
jgi:CRP-like cAMP-binding protein